MRTDLAAADAAIQVRVDKLEVHFPIYKGIFRRKTGSVKAVDGVSFEIRKGETLGLVGESGCGKSTTGRALLRLCRATGGRILFAGVDIASTGRSALRRMRPKMQMIFQDPQSSLNPRMTVGAIVAEPLIEHVKMRSHARSERVRQLLAAVGLGPHCVNRYPHEFSGGQRQRIAIARAMVLEPKFVMLDEPTSALDMSVQAQIVDLLRDLQKKRDLSYLFISHDLKVVRALCNYVIVLRGGKSVEEGPARQIFESPKEDYTKALLAAALDHRVAHRGALAG